MILGIGIDVIDIRRIERLLASRGKRFLERTFTGKEQRTCEARSARAASYAKRFAAKEAAAKALGTGLGRDALFTDIEITNDKRGAPAVTLSGKALKRLAAITPHGYKAKLFISLSDEADIAMAQVIIEAIKV